MLMKTLKNTMVAWAQSLRAVARSPIYVLAVAAIACLWGLAAYEWLWLPESSVWMLGLAAVWIVALAVFALALLAGSVAGATAVTCGTESHLRLSKILSLEKRRLGRTLLVVLAGTVVGAVLCWLFGWFDGHALDVASFLTFHLQRPVSYVPISKFLSVIEAAIWISFAGFAMAWLMMFSNPRGTVAPRSAGKTLARFVSLPVFLTGVLAAVVFGGLAWLLATWHPVVKPGGWDYAQFVIRNGAALLLITVGWLFWTLALARLALPAVAETFESPPGA